MNRLVSNTSFALTSALALGVGSLASAQVVQASGAPIVGVCVYSENAMLGQSQAGLAANQQLAQLQQSVNADLRATRDKLVADDRTLTSQKAQLSAADFTQRAADLQRRARDLESLSRVRDNQLSRTRDEAVGRISKAALPVFNASLTAHRCAIVLDKGPVYSVNPVMDLTGEVVQGVNAAMPSISVPLAAPQTAQP